MSINSKNGEYSINRLGAANLPDLEGLYTSVYKKLPVPGFFSRKYNTSFAGVMYTGFIAYNRAQLPVAFYGVVPCFIRLNDEAMLAAQSADTMTHPDYRNRGLFVELALLTFDLCRNEGIKLLFGFPNQNSLPGFVNKLGWQVPERMDCFIVLAGPFNWRRLLRKLPVARKFYAAYSQKLLKKYSVPQLGVENSVFADGFGGVSRNSQYLEYKTYSSTQVIKIAGTTLWIKAGNELLIGDILLADDFNAIMTRIKKITRKLGLKEIHFHASPGTTLHTLFSQRFGSTPSFPVIFKDLTGDTAFDKIKFTTADIDTF